MLHSSRHLDTRSTFLCWIQAFQISCLLQRQFADLRFK